MEQIYALPAMKNLPAGVREVKFGENEVFAELVSNFVLAVSAGVMLVFAVLILLYRRILPPFVNMASLLLAPLGGVLVLHLLGIPVSMPVYIGLLMLFGIVAKNSILLVDFAIEEMRHGKDRMHAMMEAGHKRAQPIVMTTVAMVARSEEHTSELQSLMRITYAVFRLKQKNLHNMCLILDYGRQLIIY